MRVDIHTHYLPRPYRERLREFAKPVRIERQDGREVIVTPSITDPISPGFTDLDARLDWMDEHGIDMSVLSVSTPKAPNPNQGPYTVEETVALVEAINDGMAAARREHPERIAGLGMLPLRDPEAALEELDRIVDLGLAGISLPTTVRGEKLSAPKFEPVFDALENSGLAAFVHPKRNALSDDLEADEGRINPLVVYPTETTLQIGRLIFDGFFDRHDLDLVLSHLGGALPYLVGRLERGREQFRADGDIPPDREITEYLQEFYYDTILFHPPAMRAAIETVGADRLLLGTDYPFGMEDVAATLDDVETLELSSSAVDGMLGGTAEALFDL